MLNVFEIARQIYNTMVRAELKKLRKMELSQPYRSIQEQIKRSTGRTKTTSSKLRSLYNERISVLKKNGFTEYGFKSDIKYYYKYFNDNIGSSVAVHGIAPQVWAAFEKMLFRKEGKKVHYKKKDDIHSLRGYSVTGKSGGVEIISTKRISSGKDLNYR